MLENSINTYTNIEVSTIGLLCTNIVISFKSMNKYSCMYLSSCGNPGLSSKIKNYVGKLSQSIFLFLFLSLSATINMALLSYGFGLFLSTIFLLYYSKLYITYPKYKHILSILKFSKWSIPNSIANDFYQRFDTIILSIMVGSIAVGYYDSSVRISTFGFAFAYGLSTTSNIKISGMFENNENIIPIIEDIISTSALFVYPTLIIAILHSEYILNILFGAEYIAASGYLIAIITYQILQACEVPR